MGSRTNVNVNHCCGFSILLANHSNELLPWTCKPSACSGWVSRTCDIACLIEVQALLRMTRYAIFWSGMTSNWGTSFRCGKVVRPDSQGLQLQFSLRAFLIVAMLIGVASGSGNGDAMERHVAACEDVYERHCARKKMMTFYCGRFSVAGSMRDRHRFCIKPPAI